LSGGARLATMEGMSNSSLQEAKRRSNPVLFDPGLLRFSRNDGK
jgi:hypothetical protein